jgi:hypothetical protein
MKSAAAVVLLLTMVLASASAMALDSSVGSASLSAGFFDWDWFYRYFGGQNPTYPGSSVAPIPEPSAALVFGAGLLVAAVAVRRRR